MTNLINKANEAIDKINEIKPEENIGHIKAEDFENKLDLINKVAELEAQLRNLKAVKSSKPRHNRKAQVLKLIKEDVISINEIAETLGISNKNVSSILCYLRKEDHNIETKKVAGQSYIIYYHE